MDTQDKEPDTVSELLAEIRANDKRIYNALRRVVMDDLEVTRDLLRATVHDVVVSEVQAYFARESTQNTIVNAAVRNVSDKMGYEIRRLVSDTITERVKRMADYIALKVEREQAANPATTVLDEETQSAIIQAHATEKAANQLLATYGTGARATTQIGAGIVAVVTNLKHSRPLFYWTAQHKYVVLYETDTELDDEIHNMLTGN